MVGEEQKIQAEENEEVAEASTNTRPKGTIRPPERRSMEEGYGEPFQKRHLAMAEVR